MIPQPSCAPLLASPAPCPPVPRALRVFDWLVESSVLVSAGAVALAAWASLELDGRVDVVGCAALALFVFAVYTLDRYRAQPEDVCTEARDVDPAAFVARHRPAVRGALAVAAVGLTVLVVHRPRLLASLAISCAASVFYIVPLPLLGRRLKEIPFFKDVYAPTVFVSFAAAFLGKLPDSPRTASVLAAMVVLCQINNVPFDLKDVDNDRRAGLTLLSTVLPARALLTALVAEALVVAAAFALFLPAPTNVCAATAALANVPILWLLRRRFSSRLVFVLDGLLAVPLAVTLLVR